MEQMEQLLNKSPTGNTGNTYEYCITCKYVVKDYE